MDYLASEFLAAYLDVGQSSPKPPGYVVVRTDTVEGLRTLQNSMRRPRVRSAIASAMPSVATLAKASQTPIMDAALQCLITRTSADQADAGPGDAAPLDDAPTDDVQEDPELAEEEEEEDAPPSPLRPVAASAPSLHDMQAQLIQLMDERFEAMFARLAPPSANVPPAAPQFPLDSDSESGSESEPDEDYDEVSLLEAFPVVPVAAKELPVTIPAWEYEASPERVTWLRERQRTVLSGLPKIADPVGACRRAFKRAVPEPSTYGRSASSIGADADKQLAHLQQNLMGIFLAMTEPKQELVEDAAILGDLLLSVQLAARARCFLAEPALFKKIFADKDARNEQFRSDVHAAATAVAEAEAAERTMAELTSKVASPKVKASRKAAGRRQPATRPRTHASGSPSQSSSSPSSSTSERPPTTNAPPKKTDPSSPAPRPSGKTPARH